MLLCGSQRTLALEQLSLEGGAEIDLSPLSSLTTLHEASFRNSSGVANIAPLAKIAALQTLDITGCERVTDRRAFAASVGLTIIPE